MFGNVTALEGLHGTGKYRTQHDAHVLQACGLGSSHEWWSIPQSDSTMSGSSERLGALGPVCKVQGPGCRVQGPGCRVQGPGCRVQGPGFRVQGSGCKVSLLRAPSFLGRSKLPAICRAWAVGSVQRFRGGLKAYRLCVSLNSGLESNKEEKKKVRELLGP